MDVLIKYIRPYMCISVFMCISTRRSVKLPKNFKNLFFQLDYQNLLTVKLEAFVHE